MVDEEYVKNLYKSDQYLKENPELFERDTQFKVKHIIPLVDVFISNINKKEINLLDVGGGSGLILKKISDYIQKKRNMSVNKFIMDLSPGMVEKQCEVNPDIKIKLNEDICHTSLKDDEIDLTLMIDVLEHVKNPTMALTELKRISKSVIFKVPLENNLLFHLNNLKTRGEYRKKTENLGHVNIYSLQKLKSDIENYYGNIRTCHLTNRSEYVLQKRKMVISSYLIYFIGSKLSHISPHVTSYLLLDFAMILTYRHA